MDALDVLLDDIGRRTAAVAEAHAAWPCRKGCSNCCRMLAVEPELTTPELDLLAGGLAALPPATRDRIRTQLLDTGNGRICPLLDREQGTCLVYEHRPAACRTYGFYVDREGGLYCNEIRRRIDVGDFPGVIWGNQSAVEARLDQLGPRSPLFDWLRCYLA